MSFGKEFHSLVMSWVNKYFISSDSPTSQFLSPGSGIGQKDGKRTSIYSLFFI